MRIGTRGSALALAQARLVADRLEIGQQGECEIVRISTSGDRRRGPGPGAPDEDKSRWVAELEDALLSRKIDLAVHSAKDVPGELGEGLALLGAPARAAVEDVLCGADRLDGLAPGARVGTSSVRRAAQLRAAREDLEVVEIAGNVDTRLGKLERGEFDAIVLARAGLQRLGLDGGSVGTALDPARFVPAPGQGALALEARADDVGLRNAAREITDAETFACLLAERALARDLSASCHTPLGAWAAPAGGDHLDLRAWVGLPDGSAWVSDELRGPIDDPEALGRDVAERLSLAGAGEMLSRAEKMASVGNG
jgi:hydroxymethylbilane synthase